MWPTMSSGCTRSTRARTRAVTRSSCTWRALVRCTRPERTRLSSLRKRSPTRRTRLLGLGFFTPTSYTLAVSIEATLHSRWTRMPYFIDIDGVNVFLRASSSTGFLPKLWRAVFAICFQQHQAQYKLPTPQEIADFLDDCNPLGSSEPRDPHAEDVYEEGEEVILVTQGIVS
jgi:hypothetical protein